MQIPPGSASALSPAAILPPSPEDGRRQRRSHRTVDPDAKLGAVLVGRLCVAVNHSWLYLGSVPYRMADAGKLRQYTVAGALTIAPRYSWIFGSASSSRRT
jgi:hypothetical protein